MKKLKKEKKYLTMKSLANLTKRSAKTLTELYYDFIVEQIELLNVKLVGGGLSIEKITIGQNKKMNQYMNLSDKALGIGLKDYNSFM